MSRDLTLATRNESTRTAHVPRVVTEFSLVQIKEHFDENINSIKNQLEVAKTLNENSKIEECKYIWRSQIVYLESALDFYIHELSKINIIKMFNNELNKSDKYHNLKIPMKYVECGIQDPGHSSWLLEYLNDKFSSEVFLSLELMKDQLNLIGIPFETVIQTAFPKNTGKDGKSIIRNLYNRRNSIAHQSDRCHETAIQNDITESYVLECINDVCTLVDEIHKTATTLSS